jgi:hypothetical protein
VSTRNGRRKSNLVAVRRTHKRTKKSLRYTTPLLHLCLHLNSTKTSTSLSNSNSSNVATTKRTHKHTTKTQLHVYLYVHLHSTKMSSSHLVPMSKHTRKQHTK